MTQNRSLPSAQSEVRVSARGLLTYAETFYWSFDALVEIDSHTTKFHPTQYYLASHSIELALKSMIFQSELSVPNLMRLGHKLGLLVSRVAELGVDFTATELEVIKSLDVYYSSKELEYFVRGCKEFPALNYVDMVALSVLNKAREYILKHAQ